MKVKFLQDFQGRETREAFYKQGQEVELPDNMAQRLVADGRARVVTPAPVQVEYHDLTPQFENAAEPPKPEPKKRGKK